MSKKKKKEKPTNLFVFISSEWQHTAAILHEIERKTGLKLTLSQVRRSMLSFPGVVHDETNDNLRLVPDPNINQ